MSFSMTTKMAAPMIKCQMCCNLGNLIEAICKDRFHWSSSASGIDDATNEMIVFAGRDNEG